MTFEHIYEEYKDLVYNLALQYVQNVEDAEEITQDVFVAVYHGVDRFQANSSTKTWIYRIAINKSLDYLKAKKAKKRFAFFVSIFSDEQNDGFYHPKEFNHPGVLMEDKESIKNIFIQINTLPENQKTALILSKIEGQSQKEIGEIMQLSNKAVESLVQRAKTNLSKLLVQSEG